MSREIFFSGIFIEESPEDMGIPYNFKDLSQSPRCRKLIEGVPMDVSLKGFWSEVIGYTGLIARESGPFSSSLFTSG